MAIPLAYNLRNLTVRKTTTLMTALGIALTVSVLVAVLALVNGLQSAFKASGNPLNILVMRKGANSELSGGMTIDAFQSLKAKPGIARGPAESRAGPPVLTTSSVRPQAASAKTRYGPARAATTAPITR